MATVDTTGAIIIGAVAGVLVVLVVELLDFKLHVDDPVGAVAVHCANGIWVPWQTVCSTPQTDFSMAVAFITWASSVWE